MLLLLLILLNMTVLTNATPINPLVEQSMSNLHNNILRSSESDMDKIIEDLQTQCFFHQCDKQQQLNQLKQQVEKEITYHQARLNNRINRFALEDGAVWTGITVVGIATTYGIYHFWHKNYNDQFNRLCSDLKTKICASVTEKLTYFGNTPTNTITISVPRGLSAEQMNYAEQAKNTLVSLRNKKERALKFEFAGLTATLFAAFFTYSHLRDGLFPKHKAHYEKFCLARDRIDNALQALKK